MWHLALSSLGIGASMIGDLFDPVATETAQATIAAALDGGMSYIDTAPYHGRGLSERRVGDAVRGRGDVFVSTEVGRLMRPNVSVADERERDGVRSPMPFAAEYDYTGEGSLRLHEASLHRPGPARVGLLLIHDTGRMNHGDRHDHYWEPLTTGGGFAALVWTHCTSPARRDPAGRGAIRCRSRSRSTSCSRRARPRACR